MQAVFDEEACREFLGDIEADVKLALNGAAQEDRQKWKEWCAMAVSSGSRVLHRATKYRDVAQPTAAPTAHGASAHVRDVVRHEVGLYKRLWPSSRPVPAWIPDRTALPKATPDEIRA
eukprot:164791-Pyramimonas_sp.AAC.1